MNTQQTALACSPTQQESAKRYWLCRTSLIISDILALFLSFLFSVKLSDISSIPLILDRTGAIFLTLSLICLALFVIKGHYSKRIPFWDELRQMLKALVLVGLVHTLILVLLQEGPPQSISATTWVYALFTLPLMRMLTKRALLSTGLWSYPTIIIGDGENAEDTAKALAAERMMGYEIIQFLSIDAPKRASINVKGALISVTQMDNDPEKQFQQLGNPHVVVALERGGLDRIQHYVDRLSLFYPRLSVVPALRGLPLFGADMHSFFSHEVILLNLRNNLRPLANRSIKRAFDIVVSAILLLLLSPVFLYIVEKIRKSGGPAFFAHSRIGRNGVTFPCYKFRSMVPNAQEVLQNLLDTSPEARAEWDKDFKLKNDPRITPIGSFLRKTSLDELPQLWNVLKGEMSLVGPRPVISEELDRYGERAVHYLQAKPGMTGLWQVSGRNDVDYESRVYLDAWYVKNWNLWTDIVILFKTVGVVLQRDGAY